MTCLQAKHAHEQPHDRGLGRHGQQEIGRPVSAIVAGYLGLFSLFPFFGVFAIIASLVAFRALKQNP
jgi:hypothetical protein